MGSFEHDQKAFADALRNVDLPPPASIGPRSGAAVQRRFSVYRSNVYAGLIGVLEARYPAVARLVGDDFFRAMTRIFIDRMPPRSPVLLEYGDGFAEFLRMFEPAQDEPYLPDVAALEWRMHVARHAADCATLPVSCLAACDETASGLTFRLAPSVAIVASDYPVFSLWRANASEEKAAGPMTFAGAEWVLVSRPALTPEAVRIPEACARFVAALLDGLTLGEAAEAALDLQPGFALNRAIALLIAQKAIVSIRPRPFRPEDLQPW